MLPSCHVGFRLKRRLGSALSDNGRLLVVCVASHAWRGICCPSCLESQCFLLAFLDTSMQQLLLLHSETHISRPRPSSFWHRSRVTFSLALAHVSIIVFIYIYIHCTYVKITHHVYIICASFYFVVTLFLSLCFVKTNRAGIGDQQQRTDPIRPQRIFAARAVFQRRERSGWQEGRRLPFRRISASRRQGKLSFFSKETTLAS